MERQLKTVGKNELIQIDVNKVLGHGAFGKVIFGRFKENDVAVKRLDSDLATVIEKEINLLETFQHPNVIEYLCHDVDEEYHYIVLQLCSGSLNEYIKNPLKYHEKLPVSQVMLQSALGLEFLHSNRILHRDITLGNILLYEGLSAYQVKISDFGISKKLPPDLTSITASTSGTHTYMASEVLNKERERQSSDIFSLGIVFFKLLCEGKQHPFGNNKVDIPSNICKRQKPNLEPLKGHYHDLISSMLNHTASKRPSAKWIVKLLRKRSPRQDSEKASNTVHIIGSKGDDIKIDGCKIHFPNGTFERDATVSVSVAIDGSDLPDDQVAISPELNIVSDLPLLKPATIQLPTWCGKDDTAESEDVTVHIRHKPDGREKWETITTLPLTQSPMVKFQCQVFRPIRAIIDAIFSLFQATKYPLIGFMYTNERDDAIFIGLCLKNDILESQTKNAMKEMGGTFKRPINATEFKANEKVTVELSTEDTNILLLPSSRYTLTIDDSFIKSTRKIIYMFTVAKKTQGPNDRVHMMLSVTKNEARDPYNLHPFYYTWNEKRDRTAHSKNRAATSSSDDSKQEKNLPPMTTNIIKNYTVGTMVRGKAQATISSRGCSTAVADRTAHSKIRAATTSSDDSKQEKNLPPVTTKITKKYTVGTLVRDKARVKISSQGCSTAVAEIKIGNAAHATATPHDEGTSSESTDEEDSSPLPKRKRLA